MFVSLTLLLFLLIHIILLYIQLFNGISIVKILMKSALQVNANCSNNSMNFMLQIYLYSSIVLIIFFKLTFLIHTQRLFVLYNHFLQIFFKNIIFMYYIFISLPYLNSFLIVNIIKLLRNFFQEKFESYVIMSCASKKKTKSIQLKKILKNK
ncbi:hypothetical protein RFI_29681 [Reticulomyxa filosa]|uniref:Transmembrane protein n=1 Tax=Reticulomyxa filosa TaxID=46433 RepID=X6M3V5_RETFI|nr:hypothetical protein RFI_29681 [Reticulomyxa filosa]|eukprot:ETO07710.1 hypothetical protein RFI_29681 [Reticulomyxa filosa]